MSCYFLARITIHDPQTYQKYLERVDAVFSKFHGTYLALDDHPGVLEGTWDCTRTVLIRFDSREDLLDWYHSPEYSEILQFRLSSAHCDSVVLEGLPL